MAGAGSSQTYTVGPVRSTGRRFTRWERRARRRSSWLLLVDVLFFTVLLVHGMFLVADAPTAEARGVGLLLVFAAGKVFDRKES